MITIKIKTENEAFRDGGEVARILADLSDDLRKGRRKFKLYDANGNACGTVAYTGRDK